jgi:hypothetical protein
MYYGSHVTRAESTGSVDAVVQGRSRDVLAPSPSGTVPERGGPDGVQFAASGRFWRKPRQGVILTDELGTIIEATEDAADLFHSSVKSLLGTSFHNLLSTSSRALVDGMFAGLCSDRFKSCRTTIVRADQSSFEAEIAGALLNFKDVRLYFLVSDVSNEARERAEESVIIAEAPKQSARRDAERPGLASSIREVCHSMGQPTTVLIGNLTLLGQVLDPSHAEASDLLQECMKASERVAEIIYGLRRMAD